jgi:hypothetical protein
MGTQVKLELVAGPTRLDISDIQAFLWQGHDGMGMVDLHRLAIRGPQQNGETDMGFLLDPRMIQLAVRIMGTSIDDMYNKQNQIINMCNPSNTPIGLCFTRLNAGVVSQIDVFAVGGLKFSTTERKGFTIVANISLRAEDPTFYDPTPGYIGFGVGGGSGVWAIPWAIPWAIGASVVNATGVIAYPGTADSFFYGTITGPITNPVITFSDGVTTQKLDFTGITINAGHSYLIDTRYPYKTVLYDDGTTIKNGDLSLDSNLATIDINKCLPGEAVHNTTVTVTGSVANAATRIDINYYNRYIASR